MAMICLIFLLGALTAKSTSGYTHPCALRDYGDERKVCVCNATYCDTITRENTIGRDEFMTLVSCKDGLRFQKNIGKFSQNETKPGATSNSVLSWLLGSSTSDTLLLTINTTVRYQKIVGFGGAFTDAAGINILSLGKEMQEMLLRSYFSDEGIEYNLCRVPVSGTDFSTHPYSYDDNNGLPDPLLKNFSLAKEDLKYKIPMILRAQSMSKRNIKLVAASWSPPPWMKTNNDFSGLSFLKPEYYDSYAKYILRFLDEYNKNNVTIWAISTGNEPSNGVLPVKHFNSLGWTPIGIANWTTHYFGPQLRGSTHNQTLILAFDDQRLFLPWWIDLMVKANRRVLDFIDGIAIHWYWDMFISDKVIKELHQNYPSKFLLYTEASQGDKPWEKKVELGSWERGEAYLADIIQNLNAWVTGWMDWNLALDEQGGPTWAKNYVDSPILVNASGGEFYKQPMFYAIGHVTKFIERDAERIEISPSDQTEIQATAVVNPDARLVIVMINKVNVEKNVSIQVPRKGWMNFKLPARSFATIVCDLKD
ncbi:lysosomal acid glucosylceramidase-like [Macrosteles quadrilineatus]|uniref:lysosomal acid glucosylceramidase-like n=1 Tax=Macrosteles quadrilineatus TaxID=74068 RepID=UPI0023E12747|nr:lysosomal acid glucosylceramidase-like [Macrosteles quadrilineatus]